MATSERWRDVVDELGGELRECPRARRCAGRRRRRHDGRRGGALAGADDDRVRSRHRRQRPVHAGARARRREGRGAAGEPDSSPLPGVGAGTAAVSRPGSALRGLRSGRRSGDLPVHPSIRGCAAGAADLNQARAELGLAPIERFFGAISDGLALVATFPQLEYPRRWPAHVHVTGPMLFELRHPEVELPEGDLPLVVVAASTAPGPGDDPGPDRARGALPTSPCRVLATDQRGPGEVVRAGARERRRRRLGLVLAGTTRQPR